VYLHTKAYRIFDLSGKAGLPTAFFLELVVCGKEMLKLDPSPDNPFRDLWSDYWSGRQQLGLFCQHHSASFL
jgi:hypothetical protein